MVDAAKLQVILEDIESDFPVMGIALVPQHSKSKHYVHTFYEGSKPTGLCTCIRTLSEPVYGNCICWNDVNSKDRDTVMQTIAGAAEVIKQLSEKYKAA